MKSYYDEILETIQQHIQEGELDEAMVLIRTELKMPYIPVEFEKELKGCLAEVKEASGVRSKIDLDDEELEVYLFGSDEMQLVAVNKLNDSNLHQYLELLNRYFRSSPNPSAAALLIDSCIEQKIDESFVYCKGSMEFEFTPCICLRPIESDGFNQAQSYLSEWFESEDASFYEFTIQQLIHDCFDYLPLSYEEEDSYSLAKQVVRTVLALMGREDEWNELKNKLIERQDSVNNQFLS